MSYKKCPAVLKKAYDMIDVLQEHQFIHPEMDWEELVMALHLVAMQMVLNPFQDPDGYILHINEIQLFVTRTQALANKAFRIFSKVHNLDLFV
jgi:hypothetical protein